MVNTEGVYGGAGFGDLCLEEPCTIRLCPWGTYGSTEPGLPEDTGVLTSYFIDK